MSVARDKWVEDQARYFKRKVEGLEAREERLEVIARVLYVLTFLATVALIFFGASLKKEFLTDDVDVKTALVFLMGLLPLWIGLWEIHEGRMATRERLWQYRNQTSLFARASARLNHLDAPPATLDVFVELAERSLFETYLWTIHRFHREFEPPSAG